MLINLQNMFFIFLKIEHATVYVNIAN